MQLRALWAHRGGTWALPGGAIERGESAVEAALRESSEELGIDASTVAVVGSRAADCGGGWVYETVLALAVGEVEVEDLAESDGHAWVSPTELLDLPLHPAFRAAWIDPDAVLAGFVADTDR